jgi:hypothetical protein
MFAQPALDAGAAARADLGNPAVPVETVAPEPEGQLDQTPDAHWSQSGAHSLVDPG